MSTILVTGGTGNLGRPTVAQLRAADHAVRVLSRRPGPDLSVGDLASGAGLEAALSGVDTLVHLSTSKRGKGDVAQLRTLLPYARQVSHFVLISIVGIDKVPLAYYRGKLEVERLLVESALPYSIQRATQFSYLLEEVLTAQRLSPVLLAPAVPFQPISVDDVASRLTEIAAGPAAGRLPDIGGPEQLPFPEFAEQWKRATGSRRPIVPVRLPGKAFRALAAGEHMVPGTPYGTATFQDYLSAKASR